MTGELRAQHTRGGHEADAVIIEDGARVDPAPALELCQPEPRLLRRRAPEEEPCVKTLRAIEWGDEARAVDELAEARDQVVPLQRIAERNAAVNLVTHDIDESAIGFGQHGSVIVDGEQDRGLLEQFAEGRDDVGGGDAATFRARLQVHRGTERIEHAVVIAGQFGGIGALHGASGKAQGVGCEAAVRSTLHHEDLGDAMRPIADEDDRRSGPGDGGGAITVGIHADRPTRPRVGAADHRMRAAVIQEFGGPENLAVTDVARPAATHGQVLVRVDVCGLNILDILIRRGTPGVDVTLPHVPGCDIVGTVVDAPGPDAETLVGRSVVVEPLIDVGMLGQQRPGGLAEYVVVPGANALPIDVHSDDDRDAYAALPVAYGTARRMLVERARVRPGEVVLVRGAGGGVGLACVQLALLLGARVIASSTSDAKLERLRALGVDHTMLQTDGDQAQHVRELSDGGADIVVDFLGRATWKETLRSARAGGRIVACGNSTGHSADTDLRYIWARELTILGSNGWVHDDLCSLIDSVRAGLLRPVIDSVHPLARAGTAMARIEERAAFGRVLVTMD